MKLSKNKILIIGFILWPIIIAIPQFNLYYFEGLLTGKLNYGEVPTQFYLGLVSGLFAALIFWVLSILLAKLITLVRKKELRGSIAFFYITLFLFAIMLLTQGKSFFRALNLDETKVNKTRDRIKQHEARDSNMNK
jgi:hypothetical protein